MKRARIPKAVQLEIQRLRYDAAQHRAQAGRLRAMRAEILRRPMALRDPIRALKLLCQADERTALARAASDQAKALRDEHTGGVCAAGCPVHP